MTNRNGGPRHKSRQKFKKNVRARGKVGVTKFFQKLQAGDSVVLKAEPAIQKGMYHVRFHGYSGKVKGEQGNCYVVAINDRGKTKDLIVHPVHLKKL